MLKKLFLLSVIATAATSAMAENSGEQKSIVGSFEKTLPAAISDALLIDFPLELTLWGLGISPLASLPVSTVAAACSYAIRKTCNDYQEEDGKKDWRISAACGCVAGALKYSGKSLVMGNFNALQPVVGALDAGTYEATSQVRGNYVTAEYMAIEAMVSAAQYFQALKYREAGRFSGAELGKSLRMGVAVGAMVSATVHTTLAWYEVGLQSSLKSWQSWLMAFVPSTDNSKKEL